MAETTTLPPEAYIDDLLTRLLGQVHPRLRTTFFQLAVPFWFNQVLVAQLEAVLRRAKRDHEDHDYEDDYLRVNLGTEQLFIQGIRCDLTGTEFKLLAFLVRHAGQICTYDQILGNVWGWEYRDNVDYVHVHASNLRRKIEHNPRDPIYIVTERGVGYRFEPQK